MKFLFTIQTPVNKEVTVLDKVKAFKAFYAWFKEVTDNKGIALYFKRGDYYAIAKVLMPNGHHVQATLDLTI